MSFERILAIDTATEDVSVALLDAERSYFRIDHEYNKHSEQVLPLIDELFSEAGLTLKDVDAVAFGAGPGAFTGLRVACGVAQGLGWAAAKPLAAVSNLEAAALKCGESARVLVALDARMRQCYAAVYDVHQGAIQRVLSPAELLNPEDLSSLAATWKVDLVLGEAFDVYASFIELDAGIRRLSVGHADALDIARLGLIQARAGKTVSALQAAPIYVRNRVALTIEERARGEKL